VIIKQLLSKYVFTKLTADKKRTATVKLKQKLKKKQKVRKENKYFSVSECVCVFISVFTCKN